MTFEEILAKLDKVNYTGPDKATALCSGHPEKTPSLGLRDVGDRTILHCFAGCSPEVICLGMGIELSDLFVNPQSDKKTFRNGKEKMSKAVTFSPYHTTRMLREYAHKILDIADAYDHHSREVLARAQGLRIDDWTDDELEHALDIVDRAKQKQRLVSSFDNLAFDLKTCAMEREGIAHATRS